MSGSLIDCFAGGGGASKGIELALNRPIDIAVNHDPEAIRIHKVNHPHTLHLTEDIFTVDLQKYKDRFGLVNVVTELNGQQYILKDIFLRMLKAEPELKLMQGFPADYIITHDSEGRPYPIKEQVARIGNSVVPIMAKALVQANCPHMIREELSA